MIFKITDPSVNVESFVTNDIPKILNKNIFDLWDVHANLLALSSIKAYLYKEYINIDKEPIYEALNFLTSEDINEETGNFIARYVTDPIFAPFVMNIKCRYNKNFIDIESNNEIYNLMIRNIINIQLEGKVEETGTHLMNINEKISSKDFFTKKEIKKAWLNAEREKISAYQSIKDFPYELIEIAKEKLSK